jgi:hypothetical protein
MFLVGPGTRRRDGISWGVAILLPATESRSGQFYAAAQ